MTQYLGTIIAVAYLFLIPCRVLAQDAVQLRQTARLAAGAAVRIGDVAMLVGPEAQKLQEVLIGGVDPARAGEASSVSMDALRAAIEQAAAKGLVNAGRLSISGSQCRVMAGGVVESASIEPAAAAKATPVTAEQAAALSADTIRTMIIAKAVEAAGLPAADVRVLFETRDASILDKSVSGRVATITTSGSGEKLVYSVRLYEKDALVAQGEVRVGVTVRREVAVVNATLDRGSPLSTADYTVQEQWLPLTRKPAPIAEIDGTVLKGRLNAGDVIESRLIEDPLSVKKGDQIVVDCINGGIVLRTVAIATASGRQGEIIAAETVEWHKGILVRLGKSGHGVAVGPTELKTTSTRARKN